MKSNRRRWEEAKEAIETSKRLIAQAQHAGNELDLGTATMQLQMRTKYLGELEQELGGEPEPVAPIKMTPVASSSNVVAAGWREETTGGMRREFLRVEFKDGDIYEYANVSRAWFDAFLQAKSKGRELQLITSDPTAYPVTKLW